MFKTIVLGLDGSESSDQALQHATALAKEQGSSVKVVHVIEIVAGRGGGVLHLDEDELKAKVRAGQGPRGRRRRRQARVPLGHGRRPGPRHRRDRGSLERGSHHHGDAGPHRAAGILLGSVTHRLLHIAHCPLLIIPSAARAHVVAETVTEVATAAR